VNLLLQIPVEIRLAALSLLGAAVGGQLNRGIYGLACEPRNISPWAPAPPAAPARSWADRIPVLGWWRMRRETPWHGRGFWVRPLLIELATGAAFAVLYWLETERLMLWPRHPGHAVPSSLVVHAQFLSHAILLALMIVATFIDFDEKTIPDAITVTGSALGLLVAACLPMAALPTLHQPVLGPASLHHLVLTSSTTSAQWLDGWGGPCSWPAVLDQPLGLAAGLAAVWLWCFAILDKTWTTRHGILRAFQYLAASVARRRSWQVPLALGAGLSLLLVAVWTLGAERWQALLSAVAGLGFGGALIWGVRIVGGHALRTEAMGFGDVTLMAMIGAFLGWQCALLVFFVAPFTALLIATTQWLITGNRLIAFGPYLCLASVIVVGFWSAIWYNWALDLFTFGWFIPLALLCCLVAMGGLLWVWRILREAFFY